MENSIKQIESFFRSYEKIFNDSLQGNINPAATANMFADCFISADPTGVTCGSSNESFLRSIINGYNYYICCGVKSMKIASQSVTRLNEIYFLNKVKWEAYYRTNDAKSGMLIFEVIYFVEKLAEEFMIFGYITGDEKKAFQDEGILPQVELQERVGATYRYPMQRIH